MRRALSWFAAVATLLTGAAVLQLKYQVQEQAEKVEAIAAQIHHDRQAMRVLDAEWSYLTTPRMLQDNSIEFLALMPPAPEQIIETIRDIPFRLSEQEVNGDASVIRPEVLGAKPDQQKKPQSKKSGSKT